MSARTVELVVEHEQMLEAKVAAEHERIKHDLEEHAAALLEAHKARIEARSSLYDRQQSALEQELSERERISCEEATHRAKRLLISDEALITLTQQVLNGFSWRPKPSTK